MVDCFWDGAQAAYADPAAQGFYASMIHDEELQADFTLRLAETAVVQPDRRASRASCPPHPHLLSS
jgi:hypothetical protein